jgi:hypothetical protein
MAIPTIKSEIYVLIIKHYYLYLLQTYIYHMLCSCDTLYYDIAIIQHTQSNHYYQVCGNTIHTQSNHYYQVCGNTIQTQSNHYYHVEIQLLTVVSDK